MNERPAQVVVCAAVRCKDSGLIICGARHFDMIMHNTIQALEVQPKAYDQGFINQFGEYLTRCEAMAIVKENGQTFNSKRNGGSNDDTLYSEGLY